MPARCRGFKFAGVRCGIKSEGLDVGLISSDGPATAAAVFTQNRVAAAPVLLSRRALGKSGGQVNAVVVNSGNANACTGQDGARDARAMQTLAARATGHSRAHVAVASTGVIGVPLPMDRLEAGIDAAGLSLARTGWDEFTRAILTTDRGPKTARRRVELAGGAITLLGCTKGAGMIAPNMATTLTFVVSDVAVAAAPLHLMLVEACADSFNAITVDGDTSTNDTTLVMAGGASGVTARSKRDRDALEAGLRSLLSELATKLIRDGEGVHHVARVVVSGARTSRAARAIARAIAVSPLVKTAIAGCDPNWGRILCAAGNAGVPLTPSRLALDIGRVAVVRDGVVVRDWDRVEARAAKVMQRGEYEVRLDLGAGAATAHYLACDLSHEYVTINADYRT